MNNQHAVILIVIPQNRFCEQQLFDIKSVFDEVSLKSVVLSKTGKEAVGEGKTKLTPDGILVDWDKKFVQNKYYDAVLVVGGKGSRNSIWNDPVLPQILTDHFRAGKVVGAMGLSVIALLRAGLLSRQEVSVSAGEKYVEELEEAEVYISEEPLTFNEQIVTAAGWAHGKPFGEKVLELLEFPSR